MGFRVGMRVFIVVVISAAVCGVLGMFQGFMCV